MHLNVKFVLLKHQIVQQTFSVTAEMQNLDVILNAEFCPQMYLEFCKTLLALKL